MSLSRPFIGGVAVASLVIAADQASKLWLQQLLTEPPRVIEVTSFFALLAAWNRGVSFSLFNDHGGWGSYVFSALALAVAGTLLRWLWRQPSPFLAVSLGLIIGGALGNMIDRLRIGAVFDFLYFHYGPYSFPAFNLADSAISVGVALLLWDSLFGASERTK